MSGLEDIVIDEEWISSEEFKQMVTKALAEMKEAMEASEAARRRILTNWLIIG